MFQYHRGNGDISSYFSLRIEPQGECWIWRGPVSDNRPRVECVGHPKQRAEYTAWQLDGRDIPDGCRLVKTCSSALCVNPDHHEVYTPLHLRPKTVLPTAYERFMSKIKLVQREGVEGECWEWQGYIDPNGYSRFSYKSRSTYAHIFSYLHHHGEIPEGKEVDHLCRNRCCVNPAHLEAVTHYENCARSPIHPFFHPEFRGPMWHGNRGKRKQCRRGHALTEDNLYIHKGRRWCRECMRARRRDYKRLVRQRLREEKARNSEAA